jgi:hypothetical protein
MLLKFNIMTQKQIKYNEIITAIKRAETQNQVDAIIRKHPEIILNTQVKGFIYMKRREIISKEELCER